MSDMILEIPLRPCYVMRNETKEKALFHNWAYFSDVIPPSLMVGGHNGGNVSRTAAIVEFEDGTVTLIYPTNIKFVEGIFKEYSWEEENA